MPKLWSETIDAHRQDVRAAILDATWALVSEEGLSSVKMSHVAEKSGIGRATLYKYFPDVDAILLAWHQRHVDQNLAELSQIKDRYHDPLDRLRAVLVHYAAITHRRGRHAVELVAFLHRDGHAVQAEHTVARLIRDLLAEAAGTGDVRTDVSPGELAEYCLHALNAAGSLPSKAAVDRLVAVTMDGLAARLGEQNP